MKHILLISSLLAFIFFAGCEDLEDTYDDYVGDGPIRYLTKCTDVSVASGWERLTVSWKNQLDPKRNGVWIHCQSGVYTLDTIVPADSTSCDIRNLPDAQYNITVAAVSESGDTSLVESGTGRPYTYNHEAVMGYTRGITKYIFVKDRLVLFLITEQDGMLDFTLNYTDKDGNAQSHQLEFMSWMENTEILNDVDADKPIVLTRKGLLEGCTDTITFPEYTLDPELVNMAVDFENRLKERYGEFDRMTMTELELDYNLSSIEDILYFPNLETLKLGSNRYYDGEPYDNPVSELTEDEYGDKAWEVLYAFKDINPDFTVLNYGGEEYGLWSDYYVVENEDKATLPDNLELLDPTGFVVKEGADTLANRGAALFDDNPSTSWESLASQSQQTHNLDIDMQETKTVKGLKIVQTNATTNSSNYKPSTISVYVSTDGRNWTQPFHVEVNTLGLGSGEAKLLDFATEQNVRYIRLTVRDVYYGTSYSCILGDVIPY